MSKETIDIKITKLDSEDGWIGQCKMKFVFVRYGDNHAETLDRMIAALSKRGYKVGNLKEVMEIYSEIEDTSKSGINIDNSFSEIFSDWSASTSASEDEKELAQDFCYFLDSHFNQTLGEVMKEFSSDKSPEEVFKENAEQNMIRFNHKNFKRDFKTLYSVIIKSMKDYESS